MVPQLPTSRRARPSLTPGLQVLFKRKPVQFLAAPEIDDDQQEVCSTPLPRPLLRPLSLVCPHLLGLHGQLQLTVVPARLLQVWHIPQTGEIFATYEDYLNR